MGYARGQESDRGKPIGVTKLILQMGSIRLCLPALHNRPHLRSVYARVLSHGINQIPFFSKKRAFINFRPGLHVNHLNARAQCGGEPRCGGRRPRAR
jgi:hypothetical protein